MTRDSETTAEEALGTTIARPARVQHPPDFGLADGNGEDGCGNDVPMETPKRFPQGLGNLPQNVRFPHFHKPITSSWKEDNKNRKNDGCDPSSHHPAAGKSHPRPDSGPARIIVANRQK